jgi:hypothetical protein
VIKYLEGFGLKFKNSKIVLPKWCKRIKIDIGLSCGAPQSRIWLDNQSDLVVFCFEPAFINYSRIIRGGSKWSVSLKTKDIGKRAYVINCGFGNVNHMVKRNFYITSGDQGCSSLLKPKKFKIQKKEIVNIFPLDEFTKLLPFDDYEYIDHIKSDCQGSDLDILKRANFTLKKVAVYTLEAEQKQYFNENNTLYEIKKIFYNKGFTKYSFLSKFFNHNTKNFTVTDPTFYNNKILKKIEDKNFFIYQSQKNIFLLNNAKND